MNSSIFHNPSLGRMNIEQVAQEITRFIEKDPEGQYQILVGTDSSGGKNAVFVAAIVVYQQGKGGRYFWNKRSKEKPCHFFQERIHREVAISLEVSQKLLTELKKLAPRKGQVYEFQVHIDVGKNGPTRKIIKEVVGMVMGSGFKASIKPNSLAASNVADRYC